jgi:alpha-galactosidase
VPEGYAIEKDGAMYYAFFAPESNQDSGSASWAGEIELRGLAPGSYHVSDYANRKDLGVVKVPDGRIHASFEKHLLLEVTKKP